MPQTADHRIEAALTRLVTAEAAAVKEQVTRELLALPEARAFVARQLAAGRFEAAGWDVALYDVRATVTADEDWIERVVWWVEETGASWQTSARFCSDSAWEGRKQRKSALLRMQRSDLHAATPSNVRGRAHYQIYLTSLRFDFRFRQIESFLDTAPTRVSRLDPFCQAIHAFALLGQNSPKGMQLLEPVRNLADNDPAVLQVLMHGLWFAHQLPQHAQRLLELADDPVFAGRDEPILEYRRAYALRRLERYDEALGAIDRGIGFLSPEATEVHMDFVRERGLITAEQQSTRRLNEQFEAERVKSRAEIEEQTRLAREQLSEQLVTINQQVGDNLFKIVEVLGVFVAIIALLAGGVSSVVIGNLEWWQRLLIILTTGAVVIGFFLTLRLIVRPGRGRGINREARSRAASRRRGE